jgi:poly(A) polymerase
LLKRYRKSEGGVTRATALVYLPAEHGIRSEAIDPAAVAICQRLARGGHEAYIVGGALRDLLAGRTPKDFDIATSARPRQVGTLFRRARVIGRRFKLAHVASGPRVYEVATFRCADRLTSNRYGTLDQDAFRRDFSCNALYYAPRSERLIDYVGGVEDIRGRILRTLGAPEGSFVEDPVRMIRAVKYAQLTGFVLAGEYRMLIGRHGDRLRECSAERLTEELLKILGSGQACGILELAHKVGLLAALLPQLARSIGPRVTDTELGRRLAHLDQEVGDGRLAGRALRTLMFWGILADAAAADTRWQHAEQPTTALAQQLRQALEPLVLPQLDALRVAERIVRGAVSAPAARDSD